MLFILVPLHLSCYVIPIGSPRQVCCTESKFPNTDSRKEQSRLEQTSQEMMKFFKMGFGRYNYGLAKREGILCTFGEGGSEQMGGGGRD